MNYLDKLKHLTQRPDTANIPESRTDKADTMGEIPPHIPLSRTDRTDIQSGDQVQWQRAPVVSAPPTQTGEGLPLSMPPQIVIEPAAENPRPVYWERADLSIVGPGRTEFLAEVREGLRATYWVVAQFQGMPVWINSIVLRSKQAFEQQPKTMAAKTLFEDPEALDAFDVGAP